MNVRCSLAILSFTAVLAFAQTDGITVSVAKTLELPAEEATYQIGVLADADVTLDKVLEGVKSLNIGSKDLIGISSQQFGPSPNQTRFQYLFGLTVPFAKFKDTQEALATARRAVLALGMDLQASTILITSSEAAREAARQKLIPDLLAEARKKADQLAKAAGGNLGDVVGIGEFTGGVSGGFFGGFPSSLRFTHQMSVRFRLQ